MCNRRKENPWLFLVEAMEDEDEGDLSTKELQEELVARGFDPDSLSTSINSQVDNFIKKHTWKKEAEAKRRRFFEKAAGEESWVGKSPNVIEQAVTSIMNGEWGPRAQAAFREKTNLSTEDKAKILDDLERLRSEEDQASNNSDQEN